MASAQELARVVTWPAFSTVVHQGTRQGHFLARFETPRGVWIGLVVFGPETSLGLVQLFFNQLVADLKQAAPPEKPQLQVLPADFEKELNASLRTLFGR
jgi:hypothetical protein